MGASHAAEATAVTASPIGAGIELATQDHRRPQRSSSAFGGDLCSRAMMSKPL